MKIKEYTYEYTIDPCTAIAECCNEDESFREKALLVTCVDADDTNVIVAEHVVFGWPMPTDVSGWNDMCEDSSAWEVLCDEHHVKEA